MGARLGRSRRSSGTVASGIVIADAHVRSRASRSARVPDRFSRLAAVTPGIYSSLSQTSVRFSARTPKPSFPTFSNHGTTARIATSACSKVEYRS
jgi:hypothetical protein